MGTEYHITLVANESPSPALTRRITQRLKVINDQMSTYLKNSEITRFNESPGTDWQSISFDFVYVIRQAIKLSELTGGSFDPTIKPLIERWGFGTDFSRRQIPSKKEIESLLVAVNMHKLELQNNRIRKLDPRLQLDLSGIAKGYAVDALAEVIMQAGYDHYLVEIGGEVRAGGQRHDGRPWQVAIQQPDGKAGKVNQVITLSQKAVATSGDYQNFFEIEGIRYSHVIDPSSGQPPANNIASVTVISDNCITADALATAFMVMELEQGLTLAKQQDIAVHYILRQQQGFETRSSPAFKRLITNPS